MLRRPPRATRTDTLFPYTTLFRSPFGVVARREVELEPGDPESGGRVAVGQGVILFDVHEADGRGSRARRLEPVGGPGWCQCRRVAGPARRHRRPSGR